MEGLCRFPYVDLSAHVLFSYLLDQFPEFICQEPTLMTVLKRVDKAIDGKLTAEPAAQTQIISKERQITRRASASPVKEMRLTPTDPLNTLFLRVHFI